MKSISKSSFDTLFNNDCPYIFTKGLSTEINDLRVIVSLCKAHRSEVFLELGVRYGHTAKFILDQCPKIMKYIGVDVPVDFVPENKIQKLEIPMQVGIMAFGDKRFHPVTLNNGTQDIEDKTIIFEYLFDFIFIDADHSFNGVKRDTEIAKNLIRENGVIVWHDYGNESGVTSYLDSICDIDDIIHVEDSMAS
jgi:hypothetical protein